MPSIGIANVYEKNEGITVAAILYYKALVEMGFRTNFYQCIEGVAKDYYTEGSVVKGLHLPISYAEKALNRAIVFPIRLITVKDDILFLSDPWLLNITLFRRKVILLVHDLRLITEHSPNAAQTLLFRLMLSRLKDTFKIICISETTKKTLEERGIDSSKIAVIPHGTDLDVNPLERLKRTILRINTGKPINVVYVANDIPYKRLDFFVSIADHMKDDDESHHFKFTLLSKISSKTADSVRKGGNSNLRVVDRVERMENFYEQADVMLFPSEYEGFGRPLIEAMRAGIPVIARDLPITREVVNDAGGLMESNVVEDWCTELRTLYDAVVYEAASKKSLARSEHFSDSMFKKRVAAVFEEFRDAYPDENPMDKR